ncbi:MAG TPA: DUF1080 domain-containing protein [Bryobacteraceae bacterium]|nr:DUF1080 domain-containing protein [Bryobacteraceae bacterium]
MRNFVLIAALAASVPGIAAAQARLPESQEGWVSLFNGKDLTGWVNVGAEHWTVEDGVIHGVGVTKGYGYLMTEKHYQDFELAIRFQCVTGGNSGIFYRTSFKPGTADVAEGYQFEIDRNLYHHTGGIYTARRGWIVWPSPDNELVIKPLDWNDYVLTVVGNHFRARLNGVQVIDFTDPLNEVDDGAIALQLHAGGEANMRFKDIYIRDLSRR